MTNQATMRSYLTGITLIIVGLLIEGALVIMPPQSAKHVSASPAPSVVRDDEPTIAGTPLNIVVPSQQIALPVIAGTFNESTDEWTLSKTKAQFATSTSLPNNKAGSTLIYGHATENVFKRLEKLQVGDEAQVTTDNGYIFTYRYRSFEEVAPTNTDVLHYSGSPVLTLQTCSGFWSENRRLMTFDFVEVHKL